MHIVLYILNLCIPVLVVLSIVGITGYYNRKKSESIKKEVYSLFVENWNFDSKKSEDGKESFFDKFLRLFIDGYEEEALKESASRAKFSFYKILSLAVIACIPLLLLVLVDKKDAIMGEKDWDNMYLYTIVAVPVVLAYLVNKYIKIRQYNKLWIHHLRNRHDMEWRMMVFIKDISLLREKGYPDEEGKTPEQLKIEFINDICDFWKASSERNPDINISNDENLVEELGGLFNNR